ncbi:MAG: hypothetical protein WC479_08935 [Candidatus Izemoplasmatales bacterium]|jgi:hypothetical protein
MDKYESSVFKSNVGFFISVGGVDKYYSPNLDEDKKTLYLRQEEDINLLKYHLVILFKRDMNPIESISAYKLGGWQEVKEANYFDSKNFISPDLYKRTLEGALVRGLCYYIVELDFNDRTEKIRFAYKNNIVSPIEVSIYYVEANIEKYYQKVATQNRQELLSKMSVSCKTGDSLVNVYWQNATTEVKKICFELFIENNQLIMKNEMDADVMFKSVQGLAYGLYYFKLSQYDAKDNLIVATDLISFGLSAPNYGGKPTIRI